ncbi:PEP-CTERM sorting domain-containing protein [Chamaesiphon sp. VAR_48_metabat_135_sub]|uniref:PEP-CTERM sorting domain-containing protein n=1 Tax=Chamaesiphon sp. VAR_48_metabat_135_sub TaxID=2964699 RepID=UPI00286B3E6A|nr:PEP-CTERM sorting domain-containing protein [Chamaesiphon sp. VAR_48_metabat_135_sub]
MTIDRISQHIKLSIGLFVASTISLPISAYAVVIYDTNTGSPDGTISIYGDTLIDQPQGEPQGQQGVGMSFVPTATVSLTQVQVLLAQADGFPSANSTVFFNIFQSNGSNAPDFGQVPLLTAFNLTASGTPFNPALESATFTNGPVLTAGTQYWLIGTASGSNAVDWWGTGGNSGFFGFVDGNPPFQGGFSPDSNQKAFVISGDLVSTSVPEPFTIIGTLIGGTAAFRMKKKLGTDKSETTIQ